MELFTQIFERFENAIDSGFGLIEGDVGWLFNSLVVINVVLSTFVWMFSDEQVVVQIARRILFIGAMAWIVQNWATLTDALANTFIRLGVKAGSGQRGGIDELDPGLIAERGLSVTRPIIQTMRDLSGPVGFFENFPEILILLVATFVLLAAFIVIALQVAVAILSFKIGALVAFVLLPFSLLKPTSFIAERPLGWVVGAAVRLMVLTFVVGLGESVFAALELPPQVTARQALSAAVAAVFLMLIAMLSASLGSELVGGQPRLSAGDAYAAAARSAGMASQAGRQGASAGSKAASAGRQTVAAGRQAWSAGRRAIRAATRRRS